MRPAVPIALGAGPAAALDARACARPTEDPAPGERPGPPEDGAGGGFWMRAEQAVPVDPGGGWVAEPYWVAGNAGARSGTRLFDCASGANLIVVGEAFAADGSPLRKAGIRAIPVMRAAIAAPEAIPLSDLVAGFRAGGANAALNEQAPEVESCGCAAFYPSLRGGKQPMCAP